MSDSLAYFVDHGQVAGHQRERLMRPMLTFPQARHGIRVSRIAGQMEATDTLDSNDSARIDKCGSGLDRIAMRLD